MGELFNHCVSHLRCDIIGSGEEGLGLAVDSRSSDRDSWNPGSGLGRGGPKFCDRTLALEHALLVQT